MKKRLYAIAAALHLFLIFAVCCRDTSSLVKQGGTMFSPTAEKSAEQVESLFSAILLGPFSRENVGRQVLSGYLHAAGIQDGYGFFGASVPLSYRLEFEFHERNGGISSTELRGESGGAALRLDSFLDVVGRPDDRVIRETLIAAIARRAWAQHDNLAWLRVRFGLVESPSLRQYAEGTRESFQPLYTYDFDQSEIEAEPVP